MTQRARRWYYSFAILLFLVTAPIVVATAAGWRWSGWRQGFIQTGTLLITATERARIEVDGQPAGTTPKRISGLLPGVYRVRVTKPGYGPWEHLITVNPRRTSAVGPLRLFPDPLPSRIVNQDLLDAYTYDRTTSTVTGWAADTKSLKVIWPENFKESLAVPQEPTWVSRSPRGHRLAIGQPDATLVYSLLEPTSQPTILPSGTQLVWLASSDNLMYRIESGVLVGYDLLTQTRQEIEPANSLAVVGDSLWLEYGDAQDTLIRQRPNATSATSSVLANLRGRWTIVGPADRGVWLNEGSGSNGFLLQLNRVTGRLEQTQTGSISKLPSGSPSNTPLWVNAVEVVTLTTERVPSVLVRTSEELTDIAWIDQRHSIATLSSAGLVLRSVSARQGRSLISERRFSSETTPLGFDPARSTALVVLNQQVQAIRWR